MDRRLFIASSIGGIGACAVPKNTHGEILKTSSETLNVGSGRKSLQKLENEYIKFNLFDNGACEYLNKKTQVIWTSGPVAFQEEKEIDEGYVWVRTNRSMIEQYPGRFKGEKIAEGFRFKLIGPEQKNMGSFTITCVLKGRWLEMKINHIDASIPTLCFPTLLTCNSLIIPQDEGKWIKNPIQGRKYFPFFSRLRMRWFGGLKEDNQNGYICLFNKGLADAGVMGSGFNLFPVWQKSLGNWKGERSVLIGFTDNGYVGMAKRFRKWANENNLFRTLLDKGIQNPSVEKVIGARLIPIMQAHPALLKTNQESKLEVATLKKDGDIRVLINHADANKLIDVAQELKLEKVIFNLRGWFRGGYDYAHPDVWPPEPALGTESEFRNLCSSGSEGYKIMLHDNYQDIYEHNPSWPDGVIIRKNGMKMRGGFWAPGQCYILNAKNGYEYAVRNWKQLGTLEIDGMCIDTVAATQLYESFEKGNTLSRSECLFYKAETLKHTFDQGLLTMTEEGADFAIPYIYAAESWKSRVEGETIPLWSLVYHDCVMNYRIDPIGGELLWGRDLNQIDLTKLKRRWLEEALYGYGLATWGLPIKHLNKYKGMINEGKPIDQLFQKNVTSEMVDHKALTDDHQVEQTTYQNGSSVIVNFSNETRTVDGKTVGGESFIWE